MKEGDIGLCFQCDHCRCVVELLHPLNNTTEWYLKTINRKIRNKTVNLLPICYAYFKNIIIYDTVEKLLTI